MLTSITAFIAVLTTTQIVGGAALVGLIAVSTPVKKIDMGPPTSTRIERSYTNDHYRVFGADQG